MLANRTKKLIEELKPDTVILQTSEEWWNSAKLLQYVDSQEEMNKYSSRLGRYLGRSESYIWYPGRNWLQMLRWGMYTTLFRNFFRFGHDFRFERPGLEIKYACEAAERVGAKIHFLGGELDHKTRMQLAHETRMNLVDYFVKRFQWRDSQWIAENVNNRTKISLVGPAAFTEKCLDQHQINWYTQACATFLPQFKRIFIDEKDEELFEQIDQSKGQRIVVVVNQWHMEGIEHHWCHRYGQLPRSVEFPEGINPIGDLDLREGLFERLYNI